MLLLKMSCVMIKIKVSYSNLQCINLFSFFLLTAELSLSSLHAKSTSGGILKNEGILKKMKGF